MHSVVVVIEVLSDELVELQMVQQPMGMVAIPESIFITLHLYMKQVSIPVQQQLLIQICQGFHLHLCHQTTSLPNPDHFELGL